MLSTLLFSIILVWTVSFHVDQNTFFLLVYDMLYSGFLSPVLKKKRLFVNESASLLWMNCNHVYLSNANLRPCD